MVDLQYGYTVLLTNPLLLKLSPGYYVLVRLIDPGWIIEGDVTVPLIRPAIPMNLYELLRQFLNDLADMIPCVIVCILILLVHQVLRGVIDWLQFLLDLEFGIVWLDPKI